MATAPKNLDQARTALDPLDLYDVRGELTELLRVGAGAIRDVIKRGTIVTRN